MSFCPREAAGVASDAKMPLRKTRPKARQLTHPATRRNLEQMYDPRGNTRLLRDECLKSFASFAFAAHREKRRMTERKINI
jgi:hypothetical protein